MKHTNYSITYPYSYLTLPKTDPDAPGGGDGSSQNLEFGFVEDVAEMIFDQIDFWTPSIVVLSPNDFVIPYILIYKVRFKYKI